MEQVWPSLSIVWASGRYSDGLLLAVDEGTHYYLPWQVQVMITKIYHQLNFGSFIVLVRLILITGFE